MDAHRLWRGPAGRLEQVVIGTGAKMGNGLLLVVLGWLVLTNAGAPLADRTIFVALMTAGFGVVCASLLRRPEEAIVGYKG